MTVWSLHNESRYCVVPAEGRAVLFEHANNNCLSAAPVLPAIAERRLARIHAFFDVAEHALAVSRLWAGYLRARLRIRAGERPHLVGHRRNAAV